MLVSTVAKTYKPIAIFRNQAHSDTHGPDLEFYLVRRIHWSHTAKGLTRTTWSLCFLHQPCQHRQSSTAGVLGLLEYRRPEFDSQLGHFLGAAFKASVSSWQTGLIPTPLDSCKYSVGYIRQSILWRIWWSGGLWIQVTRTLNTGGFD